MKARYPEECSYYKMGGNGCWLLNGDELMKDTPEGLIHYLVSCRGNTAVKVDCKDCQERHTREKHLHKPSGSVIYTGITVRGYCGDTLKVLFDGREIVLRESADSLITIQFGSAGRF